MPFDANSIWQQSLRYMMRDNEGQPIKTTQSASWLETVLGIHERSAEQMNIFECGVWPRYLGRLPYTVMGYPYGQIDSNAMNYTRGHGYDLCYYLAKNWAWS